MADVRVRVGAYRTVYGTTAHTPPTNNVTRTGRGEKQELEKRLTRKIEKTPDAGADEEKERGGA